MSRRREILMKINLKNSLNRHSRINLRLSKNLKTKNDNFLLI